MNITQSIKKSLSVFVAIALVLTSIVVYKSDEVKGAGYAALTYTQVGTKNYYVAAGNDDFPFQTVADQGDRIQIIPDVSKGKNPVWPDFTKATLNGNDFNQIPGAGIYINYSDLIMDAYNVYEATSAVDSHKFQIIIKAGNPEGGDTPGDETTGNSGQDPTTEAKPSAVDMGRGFSVLLDENSKAVSIQKPAFAEYEGIYLTVPSGISSVSVNGVTEGVCGIDGAGVVVYLQALTKKTNTVVITHALGVCNITVYNENGIEDETESESGEVESTTPAGEVESTTPSGEVESTTPSGEVESTTPAGEVESTTPASEVESTTPAGEVESTTPASEVESTTPAKVVETTTPAGENNNPTQAPTTVAPTTQAPTTQAPTTTVAPTTAAPTTAAPTTTAAVKLAKGKIAKASRAKNGKKVKLTFKKIKGATSYEIKISTSKKFKKGTKTYTSKKLSKTIKKLVATKKYYVKVRAVATAKDGTVTNGKWSKVKTIKVKK
ncbi:MAG: glutamate-rich protein 5 [Lachnospiraceae bacterium]|nr:glutamate-rich protein 5 [Lachnospiraceae bacterium]